MADAKEPLSTLMDAAEYERVADNAGVAKITLSEYVRQILREELRTERVFKRYTR